MKIIEKGLGKLYENTGCALNNSMQSNFFDAIGVADMEKVHSAVIGWMLSDECNAFGPEPKGTQIRSELLRRIFQMNDTEHMKDTEGFNHIKSLIEWNDIDILIVTEKDKEKQCWIIENKVKSTQHSDQLNRYIDIVNCAYQLSSKNYKEIWRRKNAKEPEESINQYIKGLKPKGENKYAGCIKHYCFLTLIPETPLCSRCSVEWVNTKYEELLKALEDALKEVTNPTTDTIILREYLICLKNLTDVFKDFMGNHQKYENVFKDGSKTKEVKIKEWDVGMTPSQKYISVNGLETIFQKCFLSAIIPEMIKKKTGFTIKDTHGNALLEYDYKITDKAKLAFQFQNGSFKIQISIPHPESRDRSLDNEFRKLWEDKLKSISRNNRDWSFNHENSGNSPYYSLSNTHLIGKNVNKWYCQDREKIKSEWEKAHSICTAILKSLEQYL